jgi:hypothetical protein
MVRLYTPSIHILYPPKVVALRARVDPDGGETRTRRPTHRSRERPRLREFVEVPGRAGEHYRGEASPAAQRRERRKTDWL